MSRNHESNIVTRIVEAISDWPNIMIRNNHGNMMSGRGWPDLEVVYRGRFYGLEVKVEGNYPTPIQVWRMEKITNAGGIAAVVHNAEEAKAVLKGKRRWQRKK